jgi:transcriptional regulator of aromatic amino acid metabolism
MIASNAALSLLEPGDYAALTAYAGETLRNHSPLKREFVLRSGQPAELVVSPKFDGGENVGAILRLRITPSIPSSPRVEGESLSPFAQLAGRSQTFRQALQLATSAALRGAPTCIVGEAGTGKFALAQAMAAAVGVNTPRSIAHRFMGGPASWTRCNAMSYM